ncbi:GroES-like protein [Necator americanus]|uniref:GroES-like protein n=1 Tax=Necator americanus TaxID=51031 RepID=W2U021_NECAM|nr:GroES-like protein [Necator americanus]ETN86647.1 GroES-like protein [Necator americanus]
MKAALLNAFGTPLSIETLPDPVIGTGEVIVDVVAAGVASYAHGVFSGARNYLLEPPLVPGAGAIGRVRAVGPDSTRLAVGDWVYCDPTIRARDNAINPDTILQGWTARNPAALSLHRFYHHGSFATQMLVPTENVTAIGDLEERDAGKWCALSQLLVPFGGLLAGELQPGDTVLVNGETGGFGSAGVVAALAMGAAKVVAAGRNQQKLDELPRQLASIELLFQKVSVSFPLLDTLVNNAGAMRNIKLDQQYQLNDLTAEINGNLNGTIWMVQTFLPLLLRRKGSLIVNVSSGLAFVPFPAAPIYSASKAAIHAYTRCLRAQLEGSFVSIVELAPPATETPLFRGEFAEEMKGEKGMDVSVLVKHTIDGIETGKQEVRPGLSNVLKIASRVAPQFMFRQMVKLGRPRSSGV